MGVLDTSSDEQLPIAYYITVIVQTRSNSNTKTISDLNRTKIGNLENHKAYHHTLHYQHIRN